MAYRLDWKHQLEMPFADRVHDAILAFLRTSGHGEWKPDEIEESDRFVLHFRRGVWNRSLFGMAKRLIPEPSWKNDPTRSSMTLRITLRPSPDSVNIGLFHSLHWTMGYAENYAKQASDFYTEYVKAEVGALADYLRDFFQLPEPPGIEST